MWNIPPSTDNKELDQYNLELVSYLANLPPTPVFDQKTGIITSLIDGSVIGYLNRYLSIKYADNNKGLNFSNTPTNRLYYGLLNSEDTMESGDYSKYTWYPVTGGFGASNKLWFRNLGGRNIDFFVNVTPPSYKWNEAPLSVIDLDDIIGVGSVGTDLLADGAVTTIKLANNAVNSTKLADNAVTTNKLADFAVTNAKLADASVGNSKLVNLSIDSGKIADNAVTKAKMADDSVGLAELDTTGTPDATKILNGAMAWMELPQAGLFLAQYVLILNEYVTAARMGGHTYHPTSNDIARVYSIPNPAVLDFPIGSTMVIINMINTVTLRCEVGTLTLLGTGTDTPAIQIAAFGKATATKTESGRWVVDGINLTAVADPGSTIGEGDFNFSDIAYVEAVDFDFPLA